MHFSALLLREGLILLFRGRKRSKETHSEPLDLLWYQYPNEFARCVTQPPSRSVRIRIIQSSLTIALLQNAAVEWKATCLHMHSFQKLPESLPKLLSLTMFLGLLTAIPRQVYCARCSQFKCCPLPLLSPSPVTPSTLNPENSAENMRTHWSWNLT